MKLMPLDVFRPNHDATNGGVSATNDTIYIPHERGFIDSEDVAPELIFREESLGDYHRLYRVNAPHNADQCAKPMFGGNLAATSDSRVRKIYHIHDRYESFELNDRLSR